MTTITRPIHFAIQGRRKRAVAGPAPEAGLGRKGGKGGPRGGDAGPGGRIPRVAKLMALAIRFDKLLRDGVVANQSELAKLAHVTQPRMTQIMNLLHLAPDIQEEILHLPLVAVGEDPITERDLRGMVQEVLWERQRRRWAAIRAAATSFSVAY